MIKKPTVVIVGGGYAGVRVALDLLKSELAHVVLIDQNPHHSIPAEWYEVATIFRKEPKEFSVGKEKESFHRFVRTAAIPFGQIFHTKHDIEIVRGRAERVVPEKSYVVLEGGKCIHYDFVVVSIGSKTNYFNIPHLENNSIGLKSVDEALNVRNRLDEIFKNAPKNKKITAVVGGGGFTGCELAGELVGYMHKLAKEHSHPYGNWSCVVVEAGPALLGNSSAWVQRKAAKRFAHLGVTVMLSEPIVDVWPNLLFLGEEKRKFPFDLLIWTAGVKGACEGNIIQGGSVGPRNCLAVTSELRIMGYENIFVAGDVAATMDKDGKTQMPMTAQKAVHEGLYISKSLLKLLRNPKAKLSPYTPKHSSFIIPLGGKYALLETPYVKMSGFLPWLLKHIVVFKYLRTIIPVYQAYVFAWRQVKLFTGND